MTFRHAPVRYAIAAAAAGLLAGTVHAQSSVTLYGVADAGIEYLSNVPSASGGSSQVRMTSGNMSTSRWGIRGVEDLGGGLKAIFELESGIAFDTGAQNNSSRLFDRGAFVGLGSKYGTLTLGRQTTPTYDTGLQLDPMGFAPRYSLYKSDDVLAGRADNAVKYRGKFGGLTATALYSTGRTGAGEVPGNYKVDRNLGASLLYEAGALMVGAAYDEFQGTTVATADRTDRRALIGASYAFGPARAFVGYRWYNGNVGTLPNNGSNLYWAGLRYSMSPALTLTGAAYYTDTRNSSADPIMFVASADYAFSKRTDVYMNVGYALNRGNSQLGMNGFNSTTGSPTNVVPGKDQTGVVMGIRHKF
ncbi:MULTISPECIES: porin [Cupriavidus]|jgi:predicted porin|uniref:porin n=1 Tax=Cupriavidus TaxID=106589 RepID=UPI000CE04438|nr:MULTISPECIES: porin [Cupriavidus]AVA33771.1 porin [Cupriavidus metallidurans]MCA3187548.1 porin [Cupriavidus sp.]MCA3194008.1 porin [Cupriavidus sp.]MCA3198437.1 porin [Cupriavidus sp.]MCA3236125.1 porin [Cupriavidus sp.]